MSERIILTVDSAEVDAALAKLRAAVNEANTALGGGGGNITSSLKASSKAADGLLKNIGIIQNKSSALGIPRIARSTRFILNRIPGLREAMGLLYQIRLMETAVPQIAALLIIIKTIEFIINANKEIKRVQEEQDKMIASFTGLTEAEFEAQKNPDSIYYRGMVIG